MTTHALQPNPFRSAEATPRVHVCRNGNAYDMTRAALAEFDLSCCKGKRVLLKPNAGRVATPGSGITTNPQVVAAAIDAFNEAGAVTAVGESPITGVKTPEAFESTGIAAVARDRGCPLIDMDARPHVPVDLPNGQAITSLKVCPEVFEFDIIVSIPVMKVHMHTGVTLAIKNMKGCLWRRSKVDLHMLPPHDEEDARSLDIAIGDMSELLYPHLSIIDGTVAMEGLGPSAGTAKELGLVLVGDDAFAADAIACRIMGIDPATIAHLRIGARRRAATLDADQIAVSPTSWREAISPFELAPKNLSIEFPDVNILDNQSCSACQSTLLLFLQRNGNELREYFAEDEPINIAIGKGHKTLPADTICVGNCTACHRATGTFIPGCPPVSSAILKALKDRQRNRDNS